MPQIALEYSSNVRNAADFRRAARRLHDLLAREVDTDLASCKTRIVEVNDFIVGDGAQDEAFIHVTIAVLSGRAEALKASVASEALALMTDSLSADARRQNIQITVEIRDLDSSTYRKQILRSDVLTASTV